MFRKIEYMKIGTEEVIKMGYRKALQDYIDATNTHNFNNVKSVIEPGAVYWFTDKTCTSLAEIKHYFETAWDTIHEEVYTASDVRWVTIDDHSATCTYTYKYEGFYKGEFVTGSGRATNVFKTNENGEWKLIHEHLSNNSVKK